MLKIMMLWKMMMRKLILNKFKVYFQSKTEPCFLATKLIIHGFIFMKACMRKMNSNWVADIADNEIGRSRA